MHIEYELEFTTEEWREGDMKIKDRLIDGKVHISFEVFPPKTSDTFESVKKCFVK